MNIRQAILRSAEQIERNPDMFNYWNCRVPECGSPGCFIGLIACNSGEKPRYDVHDLCPKLFGVKWEEVYSRVFELSGRAVAKNGACAWTTDPAMTARVMRLYADKYHPAESRAVIPESVRRIFMMSHAELTRELA